jgi:hypothetical protein
MLAGALAVLGCQAALATADPSSDEVVSATVYSPSGPPRNDSVSLAQLQSNPQCTPYSGTDMNEFGRTGFVDVQLVPGGTWALSTVLRCLSTPVPVGAVHGVTVITSAGIPETGPDSMLTPADLAPQGSTDFNNPQETPVVQALGSLNQYDRPWRGNGQGQTDYDYADEVLGTDNDQPQPIAIEVFEGPLLAVSVSPLNTTVPVGTVTFSARVTGQNGSSLSYSWSLDGIALNSTAASAQVTFPNAGQHTVAVQVTDSAGGGGDAESQITVGRSPSAPTGSHPHPGAGSSKKSHTPGGPRNSRGTHAGGPAGNSQGGKSTTTGNGSNTNTGTNTPTTSSTTPPSSAHTSTTPATTSGHTSTTSAPQRTALSTGTAGHATVPTTRPASRPPASGPIVSGLLVSDVAPLAAGASPLVRVVPAAVATAPPARQAVRASLLPALASGFAVLLLLGLGAGRELRGRHGRQTPPAAS